MKRSFLLLFCFLILHACKKNESVDPTLRVRPVSLKIVVKGGEYKLSWEPIRMVCITTPCPDVADIEAEGYEIQLASEELGSFQNYQTVDASVKSINIPVAGRRQLVARIVSKADGAPPANSVPVMATSGFLSQSAYYPGFGIPADLMGGDVTKDGTQATYLTSTDEGAGQYTFSLYVAKMEYERVASAKLVTHQGAISKFSPDGKQLAYYARTGTGITIYDIASAKEQSLPVKDVALIQGLAWSPDGKWLAFTTVSSEESRLWKIQISDGTITALTPAMPIRESDNIRQADIDWSPDGQYIALSYARGVATASQWRAVVSLFSPEGKGEVSYFETQPGWIDTNPSFSPDGKQLAFLSTRTDPAASTYSLWVRDVATGKSRHIDLLPGLNPSSDYVPHWLGKDRLLFMGTVQGQRGYISVFL